MRIPTRPATWLASLATLLLAAAACKPGQPDPGTETTASSNSTDAIRQPTHHGGMIDVSLVALIATPERYANSRVRVVGYAAFEFEGTALYLHREDYEQGIAKNGLWLSVEDLPVRHRNPGYVIVEGRFDATRHGHVSGWSGSIVDVIRIDEHLSREDLRNDKPRAPDAAK